MSGHSKWANIKHRKERQDAKKGKAFSQVSKMITVSAQIKGGDPSQNSDLALAIEKAKAVNMPKANIERAIKKGIGELAGAQITQETLEAFGPAGIALVFNVLTDNRNRTLAEIRKLLKESGGKLAEKGSVAWKFAKKGQLVIRQSKDMDIDQILEETIEAGASDYDQIDDGLIVYTQPSQLHAIKTKLEEKGIKIEEAGIMLQPNDSLEISDPKKAKRIIKLMHALEDHDDIESVSSDFDILEEAE